MTKGWFNDPNKHALASKGVVTKSEHTPVYVGGRTSPRFRSTPRGGRTDVYNAYHTTVDKDEAKFFVEDENDNLYKLNIDTSKIPEERILRMEDWTPEMANAFRQYGVIPFKYLEETRPDLVEHLKDERYNNLVTVEHLSEEKPLDVFAYPPSYMGEEIGLRENEIAIFDKELLLEAWENREEISPLWEDRGVKP